MTFNWTTFTYDAAWLANAVQIEQESGCDVQIGAATAASHSPVDPKQLQLQLKRVRLQALLYGELRTLLEQADLGSGMESAYVEGRQLIWAKLNNLTAEQQQYFESLLLEDEMAPQDKPFLAQLNQVLCTLLNQPEWRQIAQAAITGIQDQLLEKVALRSA